MSDKSSKKPFDKPVQAEAFDLSGIPIDMDDELWSMKQACHYVCDHMNCSPATFYRKYRHRINFDPYGRDAKTGKVGNYKCRKSQVERVVQAAFHFPENSNK